MTITNYPSVAPTTGQVSASARLLPATGRTDLSSHLAAHGPVEQHHSEMGSTWHREVKVADLRGRGGGWFPTHLKMTAVLESRRKHGVPVVIANGMEGEPESRKDAVLLDRNPHLVLDGAQVAATIVGADEVHICVKSASAASRVERALQERAATGLDPIPMRAQLGPQTYVASEESALTSWVGGQKALPTFGIRPATRGVRGRPTLVQNVETLANLALIARNGGNWYRTVGTPQAPGTTLVTLAGDFASTGVIEVPTGTAVAEMITRAGGTRSQPTAWLTGGFGGAWVATDDLVGATWDPEALQRVDAVMGASVLTALPADVCGLQEAARILSWLASQSAGQCGPCRFGLSSVSADFAELAVGRAPAGGQPKEALGRATARLSAVTGRGACRMPDGAVRMARSALSVFAEEVRWHNNGRCSGRGRRAVS